MDVGQLLHLFLNGIVTWIFDNLFVIMFIAFLIGYAVSITRDKLNLRPIQTRRSIRREPLRLHLRKL